MDLVAPFSYPEALESERMTTRNQPMSRSEVAAVALRARWGEPRLLRIGTLPPAIRRALASDVERLIQLNAPKPDSD